MQYLGDFAEDANIYIPFNTFSSDDPQASVTITNLANADIKVHKDGGLTQIATDGATVAINFDGITGNHLITIDTSVHADYSTGSDYSVRIEGTTVDGGTINAFVGSFSIENRYQHGVAQTADNDTKLTTVLARLIGTILSGNHTAQSANHTSAISTIDTVVDAILLDTGELQSNQGDWATATGFNTVIPPSVLQFNARTLLAAGYFDPSASTVSADMIAISGDIVAADNLESMYDGTGYTDDTAPSSRSQVGSLATGSSAISTTADSGTVNVGAGVLNDYTDTFTRNGIEHTIEEDVSGNFDVEYVFTVGGSGVGSQVKMFGRLEGNGDVLAVEAYNYVLAQWDQVGELIAASSTTNSEVPFPINIAHTGTGANLGEVRIRGYEAAGGLSNVTLFLDQVYIEYAIVSQSVGYDGGQIWINTVSGKAGVEPYVNGVADNESLTLANAIALGTAIPLNRFHVSNDSVITFAESHTDETWQGQGWELNLGGQNISNSHFHHCNDISGIATSPTGEAHILDSHIGAITLGVCHITDSAFSATFDASIAGEYTFESCRSGVEGAGSPTCDWSAVLATTGVNVRLWSGGGTWTFNQFCTASVEVLLGGTHTINAGGGAVEFRGTPKALVINTVAGSVVNAIVWSGCPITITGTGGTVNISGVHNGITDTSTGTTVADLGVDITLLNGVADDTGIDLPVQIAALNDFDPATEEVLSNVQKINDATVLGDGTALDKWRG